MTELKREMLPLTDLQQLVLNHVVWRNASGGVFARDLKHLSASEDVKPIKSALRKLSEMGYVHWDTKTGRYVLPCGSCGGGR